MGLKLLKKVKRSERKKPLIQEDLRRLADEYVEIEKRIQRHKIQHSLTFTRLEELETEKEERQIKIKDIARRKSEQGQVLDLINDEDIFIMVSGNQAAIEFDYNKAVEFWPADVIEQVACIDTKKVTELLHSEEHETFTEKRAMRAALPRKALTPAVTIKVKL
jgi:hypothetical protein